MVKENFKEDEKAFVCVVDGIICLGEYRAATDILGLGLRLVFDSLLCLSSFYI